MDNSMIKLNNVYFSYSKEKPLLKNITFELKKGEILTIVGASASGKTTLLKIIGKIIEQEKGTVEIKEDTVGYIPQNYGLIPWKKVSENIVLHRKLKYGKKSIDQNRVMTISKELKIDDILNKYPSNISGGQQQRVALARAFFLDTNILLMDEPFSALDSFNREKAKLFFKDICKEHNTTTIIVTHDIKEALYLGHRIGVMDNSSDSSLQIIKNDFFGIEYEDIENEYTKKVKEINKILAEDNRN